jgi:exopolysaccharide biosynthesis protein
VQVISKARVREACTVALTTLVIVWCGITTSSATQVSGHGRAITPPSPRSSVNGLDMYTINGAPFGVYTPIRVLTFDSTQFQVRVGLAKHAIDGGEEKTSAMCQSTAGCVAAVNGDFFDVTDTNMPDVGDEVGGIIQNCVLLHTPEVAHEQVNLNGGVVANSFNWSSTLDVNGTSVAVTAINQELPMSYLNVDVPLSGTLLFTAQYALKTPTAPNRLNFEFVQVGGTASPTAINTTTQLKLVAETAQPVKVSPDHIDVSATTGTALAELSVGDTVSMTTTSSAGCNDIGGHPILLDNGVVGPINRADTYMATPCARTVIGWTASGETVIMSIAGIDTKSGATMYQMVTLLLSQNVVTALDLDGGGSTSLFANGQLVYPPSKSERAVSTALLVVRTS